MALDSEAAKKVLAHIDRDELARLGCDLTSVPSPTGQEKAIAEFILTSPADFKICQNSSSWCMFNAALTGSRDPGRSVEGAQS